MSDPRIGTELGGRYRLDEVIGRGGMATVYRARQWRIGQDVAVKVLHDRFASDPKALRMLRDEAAAVAQLAHPNVVDVFDVGETDDRIPFLAMEFLEGMTLDRYIAERGRLAPTRVVNLALQIARALSRAHDFDVVHRDVKPANIFICQSDDGEPVVKLVDFGIASLDGSASHEVAGSPPYMAPERFTDRSRSIARSDLYSLGIVLFEMATGDLPFHSETPAGYLLHHVETEAPALRLLAPGCPPQLDALIASLLAKEPDHRPADAHRVVAQLAALLPEKERRIRRVTVLSSIRRSMGPSPLDRWRHRALLYDEMAGVVHGESLPQSVDGNLAEFRGAVARLASLQKEAARLDQTMAEALETLQSDRVRIGHAVETLRRDLSAAREHQAGAEHARLYQSTLAQLIDLDMRSPDAPSEEGLELLRWIWLKNSARNGDAGAANKAPAAIATP
ncbi:MAG: serine/threonine-protein kinase [Myxococcota bacterium]